MRPNNKKKLSRVDSTKCGKYTGKIITYDKNDIFVVFYMSSCPYSMGALDFLEKNRLSYKAYEILRFPEDKLDNLLNCLSESSKITGFQTIHTTLPIIFYKGKFIGGFSELKEKFSTN